MSRRHSHLVKAVMNKRTAAAVVRALPSYRELILLERSWESRFLLGKLKHAARNIMQTALRSGELVRPDRCGECCTETHPDAHHDDYDSPLAVRWLCKPCHRAADTARRAHEARARMRSAAEPPDPQVGRTKRLVVWVTRSEKNAIELVSMIDRIDESDILRDRSIEQIVARAAELRAAMRGAA